MNAFTAELISICRFFGVFERDAVCCGTVTVPQCVVLQALLDGDSDNSRLAELSGVTKSAMTRLVDGLVRRDLVARERDSRDRRRIAVRLTPAGREEALRLRALTEQAVSAVLAHIPAAKHAQVLDSMILVRGALEHARTELAQCCGPPVRAE